MLYVNYISAQIKNEGVLIPEITEETFTQMVAEVAEQYNAKQCFVLDTLDGNNRAALTDAFLVYTKGAIHHPIGQVEMKVELAMEEHQLHYSFSEFLFYPYKRSRYGRYVPANLKATPFEFPSSAKQDDQKAIQKATGQRITRLMEMLKNYLPKSK